MIESWSFLSGRQVLFYLIRVLDMGLKDKKQHPVPLFHLYSIKGNGPLYRPLPFILFALELSIPQFTLIILKVPIVI